ncbi:MAG: hypothetical protein ACR2GD_08630 [Pyrinomonadaceae bacterium]
MADEVEINEAGVVENKSKRNSIIWIFVVAAIVFLFVFILFLSGIFSTPHGAADSNSGQTQQATH